jgi:hypothetical protein
MMRPLAVALIAIAAESMGCAHRLSSPMPALSGPVALTVSREPPGPTDMPANAAYRVPATSVYLSGHKKHQWTAGAGGAGIVAPLALLVGLAIDAATNEMMGSRFARGSAGLHPDIVAATERVLDEELERRGAALPVVRAGHASTATMEIVPYLVLTRLRDDTVRVWVVLKAILKDGDSEVWTTRYAGALGESRPLGGDEGWAAADGAAFRQAVDRSLRAVADVFLRDISGQIPRAGPRVRVQAYTLWATERREFTAYLLEETADAVVLMPYLPDVFGMAGISVLDKKAVSLAPAPSAFGENIPRILPD